MSSNLKDRIPHLGLHGILFSILVAVILFAPKFLFFGTLGYAILTLTVCLLSHKSFKFRKFYWLYIALYALYVLSLLWTENKDVGLRDVEYKMLFVAGPLIFSYNKWNKHDLRTLIIGINLVIFIAFIMAIGVVLNCNDPQGCLSHDKNSLGIHPTYMSMFSVMAALMALYSFIYKLKVFPTGKYDLIIKLGSIGFFLSSSVYTYMAGSKAGVIGLFLTVIILIFLWMKGLENKRIFKLALVALSVGIIGVSYMLYQKPYYKQAVDRVIEYNQDNEYFRYIWWYVLEANGE